MTAQSRNGRWIVSAGAAVIALIAMTAAPGAAVAAPAAATSSTAVAATPFVTPALHEEIQKRVEAYRNLRQLSGLAVTVVTPGATGSGYDTSAFVAGQPTLGSSTPVSDTTQFELGSETKAFTADLLAYLLASGKVALDDPVQKYAPAGISVPEWTDGTTGVRTPITLRNLATHQAGLLDLPPNFEEGCPAGSPRPCENPRPGYTQTLLWQGISNYVLPWKPGTNWMYSNWGFGLLGTILANVVNPVPESQPPAFQEALNTAFLDGLGMTSTVVEAPSPNLVTPYDANGDPTFYWNNTNALSGGGALISDVRDMGYWVRGNLGLIPADAPAGVKSMRSSLDPVSTVTTLCNSPSDCTPDAFQMGLAWQLYPASKNDVGVPWATKDGGTAGCTTDTALAPSLGTGVSIMFNRNSAAPHDYNELAIPLLALLVASRNASPTTPTSPTTATTSTGPALAATGTAHSLPLLVVASALLVTGVAMQRLGRRPHRPATRKH